LASRSAGRRARGGDAEPGLARALALTVASALLWGVAHLRSGHRIIGGILLGAFVLLAAGAAVAGTFFRADLVALAVQPTWLSYIAGGILALGLLWVTIVIRSYQLVRPDALSLGGRMAGTLAVTVLCFAVAVPVSWGAYSTYVFRDALTGIFQAGGGNGRTVDTEDPWNGQSRVNVLLLGGDAASNRQGVRTDSMTLASVDTKTGDTVLLSLPRNLESFPMPPGPARDRFPYGFTGDGAGTPGLLNEVFQYAEEHPDLVPGARKNQRGPELLKSTISGILGQPVDYHILVDMFGFADIIDAMGGVRLKITQPIPYGQRGEILQAGDRVLKGKEALWYGRSRTMSDDYTRMGRQKCLLGAIAKQADPQTVLTKFDKLAAATKNAISTDIPQELLPAFVSLSGKVKDGARIDSLQFVPPLIHTGNPDFKLIHKLTAKAVAGEREATPSPAASPKRTSPVAGTPTPRQTQTKPTSLTASCPS
jgi:LCP family protein required for cell wall assembly